MAQSSLRSARRAGLFVAVAALQLATASAAAQHTVTLANGDRLTGRLHDIRAGLWIFTYRGTELQLPVEQVRGLLTDGPVGLRLSDGTVLGVTVRPAADSLALVGADSTLRLVAPRDIAAVGSPSDLAALRRAGVLGRALARWIVTGSLGYSDKRGNSRAWGVAAGFELTRKTKRVRLELGAGWTREASEPPDGGPIQTTVSKAQQHAQVDWYVRRRVFLSASTRQEQDRFQDIALRSTYSLGVGLQAVATSRTDLRVTVNAGWRRENYVSGGTSETAVAGLATAFRQTVGPVAFEWRIAIDPRVEDFADYRLVSRSTVTTQLYKGLGLRFEVLDEYNSRPRLGVRPNDLLMTTTVTYSLGK